MPAERTWAVDAAGTIIPGPGMPEGGWSPGVRLGPFELVRLLGEGASGNVWEAIDRRTDAPIALKLFRPARGDVLSRVLAEARAASRVVSDHVVYVRDAGEVDGVHYIAMALCREEISGDAAPVVARSLREEQPASLEEVVRWGEQMARGVAAAHAVGVFHRDLKPENVLCLPGSRVVRILDFGLASLTHTHGWNADAAARSTLVAGEGASIDVEDLRAPLTVPRGFLGPVVAGTPSYMAPEQARGFRRLPDPHRDAEALAALDVYGLGATLWALLAGQTPHAEREDTPLAVVRGRAAAGPPPSLSRVGTRFRPPRRLVRIIERAMADDPADRYASAAALAVDLARYRANRPTSNDPRWSPVRGALFLRRNPGVVSAGLWMLALLVGCVVLFGLRAELDATFTSLETAKGELVAARAEKDAEHLRVAEEERRADAAADAAYSSAKRAENAEEHVQHLRRFAAMTSENAARALDAESLARAAQLVAEADAMVAREQALQADARALEAEAARLAAEAVAADARARGAHAEELASRSLAAELAADQRAAAALAERTIAAARLERAERELANARAEVDRLTTSLAESRVDKGPSEESPVPEPAPPAGVQN